MTSLSSKTPSLHWAFFSIYHGHPHFLFIVDYLPTSWQWEKNDCAASYRMLSSPSLALVERNGNKIRNREANRLLKDSLNSGPHLTLYETRGLSTCSQAVKSSTLCPKHLGAHECFQETLIARRHVQARVISWGPIPRSTPKEAPGRQQPAQTDWAVCNEEGLNRWIQRLSSTDTIWPIIVLGTGYRESKARERLYTCQLLISYVWICILSALLCFSHQMCFEYNSIHKMGLCQWLSAPPVTQQIPDKKLLP